MMTNDDTDADDNESLPTTMTFSLQAPVFVHHTQNIQLAS